MANPFIREDTIIKVITGIPKSNAQDSGGSGSNNIIQELIVRLELVESSNRTLRTKVRELTNKVAKIESENVSLKKLLNENKVQEAHHPLTMPYT